MAEDQPQPDTPKEQPKPEPKIPEPQPRMKELPPEPKPERIPTYSMRGDSALTPIRFNDSEKFVREDNFYYRNVLKQKARPVEIEESMKWENLYYDELEDHNRNLWLVVLVSAAVIAGRLLL